VGRGADNLQRVLVGLGVVALAVAGLAYLLGGREPFHGGRILPPPDVSHLLAHSDLKRESALSRSVPPKEPQQSGSTVDLSHDPSSGPLLSAPTALVIPAIGVGTTVVPLGQNADGTAVVPSSTTYTGWYDAGPVPGDVGPAVILGHVDSYTGPGVFFNLKYLLPGDAITVVDGETSFTFRVQQVVTYAKGDFPTAEVFGPTPDAELRLITCGGPFDRAVGHYEDNVVVYAKAI
jgi:sortase (surface protein transpeptidase)